ncbi:uncharacterized protein N7511_006862 [Penicillium nucicola]|uniref:uncharacterized protein n=1 Tax=Penicillium nucicola TaxID=1850975 RepID=UPI0025454EA2|nr:uncharacterized protein N7511_006862 [Penicillium nucicola]KAJ5758168.1 hypothetical protein N7511_006862 [Penicillium nucicola]
MSVYLDKAGPQCPLRLGSAAFAKHNGGNNTLGGLLGERTFECTEGIEFKVEVRAAALESGRRGSANKTRQTFHICEEREDADLGREKRQRTAEVTKSSIGRKSSLLVQSAQQLRQSAGFVQGIKEDKLAHHTKSTVEARSKKSLLPMLRSRVPNKKPAKDPLERIGRRKTVDIPPDDATVPGVFMGVTDPPKQRSGTSLSQASDNTVINNFEPTFVKHDARKTSAASFRRGPLQQSLKVAQINPTASDIPGTGGGKENVPPGSFSLKDKYLKSDDIPSKSRRSRRATSTVAAIQAPRANRAPTHLPPASKATPLIRASTEISAARKTATAGQPPTQLSAAKQAHVDTPKEQDKVSLRMMTLGGKRGNAGNTPNEPPGRTLPHGARASLLPNRLDPCLPSQSLRIDNINITLEETQGRFSLLAHSIAKPALYEDNQLSHQETVISRPANRPFEDSVSNLPRHVARIVELLLTSMHHSQPDRDASTQMSITPDEIFSLVKRTSDLPLSHFYNSVTFLLFCSRMLLSSKRARAVTVIESPWNPHATKNLDHSDGVTRKLVKSCTTAAPSQAQMCKAVGVITRWWQDIKSRKKRKQILPRNGVRKSSVRQNTGRKGVRRL